MNELVIYIGKVLVIQAIFYGFYRFVLRKSIRHGMNRFFLLAALVVSFVIPFIHIPDRIPVQPLEESPVIVWVQESAMEFEMMPLKKESEETAFSIWHFLPWLYVLVAGLLIVRSTVYLLFIRKLKKHSEYVKKRWFKLFKTSQTRPFSFFSNVFIPKDVFGSDAFDQILAHECVHVKQRHSIDRLLMDFLVSLFWFNPFIYLYRNALIEIHEFQADEAVIDQFNDPIGYQEVLYAQLQHATYSVLVSHFNFSMIKKRIVMMNKQKNKYAGLLYAMTLPVLVSVIFAFSTKEAIEPIEHVGTELAEIIGAPIQLVNDEPSISPVKYSELARLSSEFGYRMHPVYNVRKWHAGVDFACKTGTEIVATADGVVELLEHKPDSYGKHLIIKHGDVYQTKYAQLSEFKVKEGDRVKKGDVIALSGSSGSSTAPHLHYEVNKEGKTVDPMDYITNYQFKRLKKFENKENVKQQKQTKVGSLDQAADKISKYKREGYFTLHVANPNSEQLTEVAEMKKKYGDKVKTEEIDGGDLIVHISNELNFSEIMENRDQQVAGQELRAIRFDLIQGSQKREEIVKQFKLAQEQHGEELVQISQEPDYIEIVTTMEIIRAIKSSK